MDEAAPPKMMDDATLDPELRAALQTYAASGVALDYDAGLTALRARVRGGGGGGGGLARRALLAGVGTTAVIAALWGLSGVSRETPAPSLVAPPPSPPARAPAEPSAPPPADVEPSAPSVIEPPAAIDAPSVVAPVAASSRPHESTLALEMRLLARARRSLDASPRVTLGALDAADRQVGTGTFSEERSALRVLALASLGHDAQARELGRAFLAEHPRGLFSARVRSAIGEGP